MATWNTNVISAQYGNGKLIEIEDGIARFVFGEEQKLYTYPSCFFKGDISIDKNDKSFIRTVLSDATHDANISAENKDALKKFLLHKAVGLDCVLERPYEEMVGNSKPYTPKEFGRERDSEDVYVDEQRSWICKAGSRRPPQDGFHNVRVTEINSYFYNNVEQATFTIQDVEDTREWTSRTYNLQKTIATISQENDGFLYNCTRVECIAKTQWKTLPAWTFTNDAGRTLTFFSEKDYAKYIKKLEDEKRRLEEMELEKEFVDF